MRFGVMCVFATALAGSVAACEGMVDVHGNAPPQERLDMIKTGLSSRDDVAALLGSPSSTSLFGDNSWYYISNRFESWAFMAPDEVGRLVVVIDFDNDGHVADIRKLTLNNAREVAMSDRETPTVGHDLGVLEQLLGNVGRFNNQSKDKAE
ncbi:outer membrane protein assembly factor BamE [Alphaproteobacteria bacterium]|nr:outer membrane protein assembly factor BamE [Alphaproteobacteria bacterium]